MKELLKSWWKSTWTAAIPVGTMDGRNHPGLKREKAHIGFLGHGYRLEFCKIWIKELK